MARQARGLESVCECRIVNDEVHTKVLGNLGVDVPQKAQKLLVSMTRLGDDTTIGDVQNCEQGRRPVSVVVVRKTYDVAEPHRQRRLAALEGLSLTFLLNAQHHRVFRQVQRAWLDAAPDGLGDALTMARPSEYRD